MRKLCSDRVCWCTLDMKGSCWRWKGEAGLSSRNSSSLLMSSTFTCLFVGVMINFSLFRSMCHRHKTNFCSPSMHVFGSVTLGYLSRDVCRLL